MASHPGNFVKQHDGFLFPAYSAAKKPECLRPRIWGDLGSYGLCAKPLAEILQLVEIGLSLAWAKTLNDDEVALVLSCELVEQRRLPYSAPSPASDK